MNDNAQASAMINAGAWRGGLRGTSCREGPWADKAAMAALAASRVQIALLMASCAFSSASGSDANEGICMTPPRERTAKQRVDKAFDSPTGQEEWNLEGNLAGDHCTSFCEFGSSLEQMDIRSCLPHRGCLFKTHRMPDTAPSFAWITFKCMHNARSCVRTTGCCKQQQQRCKQEAGSRDSTSLRNFSMAISSCATCRRASFSLQRRARAKANCALASTASCDAFACSHGSIADQISVSEFEISGCRFWHSNRRTLQHDAVHEM